MAKTLYEGYRIGKNGGERWVGTINSEPKPARTGHVTTRDGTKRPIRTPKGGSAFVSHSTTKHSK